MIEVREEMQRVAFNKLSVNKFNGTLCLSTGSGKSAIAISVIRTGKFKKILITSPRTNLKYNWQRELQKFGVVRDEYLPNDYIYGEHKFKIFIENIQTCYKWDESLIKDFDYVIADEVHLLASPEYGRLIQVARESDIPVTGLTATPSTHDDFKVGFYNKYIPIVHEYYDSAEDGIVNKRKYVIYNYKLDDSYTVIAGTKKNPFTVSEAKQYKYLDEQIKKGQLLMARTGSTDWFEDAAAWGWGGQGTSAQKSAAMTYLNAIKHRKSFLWNLSSSADIALKFKEVILKNSLNKVLTFSELTTQADKLSSYSIHSKNDDETNKQLLYHFDTGVIRELSSVNSLTLGLNLVGANYAIVESFNSSSTSIKQKMGRLDRLAVEEFATVIFIVPLETQAHTWFLKFSKDIDLSDAMFIENIEKIKELSF